MNKKTVFALVLLVTAIHTNNCFYRWYDPVSWVVGEWSPLSGPSAEEKLNEAVGKYDAIR